MKSKETCLALLAAESEADVQRIIDSTPDLRNPKNWCPLDGRETNFNVTSNQASDGGKALTELMTNMVDAVLMKHCYLKGINPKGKDAPATMYQAVDRLIKRLRGGKLVNLDSKDPWLKDFAQKNLLIGITGARTKKTGLPCYTFADNGEGQRPEHFEKTFLSLSEGNKKSIKFVQGKYNMGSSGVLAYCGMRWFKLIISRRYDGATPWGWTLMRRRPGIGMPVAEYFVCPHPGSIPAFESDVLYPFQKRDGKRYDGAHLATGTVVKLYDYQVGSKFGGFRSREALNENLVETILPFRLLDFRQTPDPKRTGERAEGIDPRPFYGMEFLLLRSHKESDLDEEEDAAGTESIHVGDVDDPELGRISVSAIPLKRKIPGWLEQSNNRVFHSVNGQVQFKQTRGYLAQSCGLPALKDRIVVLVDASGLTEEGHNLIWKGDREHINNTITGERYRELVTTAIKESKALEDLQHKIAQEELNQAAQTERNDLFQKLVDSDRNLAGLLTSRDPEIRVSSGGGRRAGSENGEGAFRGKYSPTFLRLEEKHDGGLAIPINRTRPIAARTDAENGYLKRAENRGHVILTDNVRESFAVREHLHDGRLTVFLEPLEAKLRIGDSFVCRLGLVDPAMVDPVECELKIHVVDEEKAEKTPKKEPRGPQPQRGKGNGKDKHGNGKDAPTHGLPRYRLLTRDGRKIGDQETLAWEGDFSETDGGLIQDLGNGEVLYKINYDNVYHIKYRLQQRGDVARDAVTEKYLLGMRILMLGYEHAFRTMEGGASNGMAEYSDQFRRMAARGAASTVLALAENLPKILDSSTLARDVE